MDVNRLGMGERIAAASAIALLLIMFIFSWFGVDAGGASAGINAWQSFGFIDLVLLITIAAALALAFIKANASTVNTPVAVSAIVTGLALLSVLLVLYRIINPPDFGLGALADAAGVDGPGISRKIGVFLGLIATAGIAFGGRTAMQEEGTSFGEQRDRLQDRDGGGA